MECNSMPPPIDCGGKPPYRFDLYKVLKELGFTDTQIEWILKDLRNYVGNKFTIESIRVFPINHIYGFKSNGDSKYGSTWNILITFENPYNNFNFLLQRNK